MRRLAGYILIPLMITSPGAFAEAADEQFDFANGLFNRGFFEEAAEEYTAYLERFPDAAEAPLAAYRLGRSAFASGKYETALAAFDQALAGALAEEEAQQALLGKSECLYYLKRYPEAVALLQPLTRQEIPAEIRVRALFFSAKAHADTKEYEAANVAFRTVITAYPESRFTPFARYQLAFVFLEAGDAENAAVEFSSLANSEADAELRMEARFRAAEVYDRIGWHSAAVDAYEKLKTEFPDSDYARRGEYGYAWALFHEAAYPAALKAARAFLTAHPESPLRPGLQYLVANCLQQQQAWQKAIEEYEAIQRTWPDTEFAMRAQYKIAWVHYLQGDQSKAKAEIHAFLKAFASAPMHGDAAFLYGTLLAAEGNYEDAHQEFRLVAEKYPESEFAREALYKSGECLSQLGMTEAAAKIFESFAKRYPASPLTEEAILRAGDAQFEAADFTDAVEKYQRLLAEAKTAGVKRETLYRLAITYHNMKDYAKSADTFEQLLALEAEGSYAAEAHFRIAEHLLRDVKEALKAIEAYQAALDAKPPEAIKGRILRGLALARYERKDYAMAADLFLQLMIEWPAVALNEESFIWTGQYFFDAKAYAKAAQVFDAMLKILPDYPYPEKLLFKIAECKEASGAVEEAIAAYAAVEEAAPGGTMAVEARFRMAKLYEQQHDLERARELYEAAAKANSGDIAARARFRLGELYEAEEAWDKAARSFMRVAILFLHPDLSPEALWRAGQAFEHLGSSDQARKAYEEIVRDYPESARVKEAETALQGLEQPGS